MKIYNLSGVVIYEHEAESRRELVARALRARADLVGADLRGAKLVGANLGAYRYYVAIAMSGHGEAGRNNRVGRELYMIADASGDEPVIYGRCGCWSGTPKELYDYIMQGEECHRQSRLDALELVMDGISRAIANDTAAVPQEVPA